MRYLDVPEEHREEVKALAHSLDPLAWESYSGMPRAYKKCMDFRRTASLEAAAARFYFDLDGVFTSEIEVY